MVDLAVWGVIGVAAAAIVLYGGKKAPDLARAMGRIPAYFKAGQAEAERELAALSRRK